MTDRYILTEDHRVVPEPDLLTWARWFEDADRHVGQDWVGPYRISTVFLGLDHDYPTVIGLPEFAHAHRLSLKLWSLTQ